MGEAVRGERLSQPYWKLNRDGRAQRTCSVPPLQGAWWTGVSLTAIGAAAVPHGRVLHTRPHATRGNVPSVGLRRQQALPAHWLPRGQGSGRPSSGTLPAVHPCVMPWAVLPVPQLPRPKFVTCFQVAFLEEPEE